MAGAEQPLHSSVTRDALPPVTRSAATDLMVSFTQASSVKLDAMSFDKAIKELAHGHDAVDRLRENQRKMVERQAAAVARRDLLLRGLALIAIFGLLAHAVRNL